MFRKKYITFSSKIVNLLWNVYFVLENCNFVVTIVHFDYENCQVLDEKLLTWYRKIVNFFFINCWLSIGKLLIYFKKIVHFV